MSNTKMTLHAKGADLPDIDFDPGIDPDLLRAVFRREAAPAAIGAAVREAFRRAVAIELHDASSEIAGLRPAPAARALALVAERGPA